MTKKRMIHAKFFKSENVGEWTIRQRLLVLGLIANADDQGRLRANPYWLRSRIFPYDDFSPDEIAEDITTIAKTNNTIAIYEGKDKKRYIQILNWWDYQSPQWAQPSDFPPPDEWCDRIRMMIYKPKRWVMTKGWPGVDDNLDCPPDRTAELSPNVLPNVLGEALPLSNTNTSISSIKEDLNEEPPSFGYLVDAFINASGFPAFGMQERDVKAGRRMVDAGVTVEDVAEGTAELLSNNYTLTGLASVEKASYNILARRTRKSKIPSSLEGYTPVSKGSKPA